MKGRGRIHTYWSNELPPALTVSPGDTITLPTLDSSHGRVAREIAELAPSGTDPALLAEISAAAYPEQSTMDRDPALTRGHPLTGPVAVAGAAPGDTLVVEVLRIEPGRWGFTACHPDIARPGLLNDCLPADSGRYHHIWDLRDGVNAIFRPGIKVPIAPFCGVIGVAPAAKGQHSTIPPGPHGGNLDLRHLTAGSVLHLPVAVPGALLSVGDAHAAQGDGEVCGTAIETEATVTLRLNLLPGTDQTHPHARTSGASLALPGPHHISTGSAPSLWEAAQIALRATVTYLMTNHALTPTEAYTLSSACVDLRITQLVNLPNYTVSAYLPLAIFI